MGDPSTSYLAIALVEERFSGLGGVRNGACQVAREVQIVPAFHRTNLVYASSTRFAPRGRGRFVHPRGSPQNRPSQPEVVELPKHNKLYRALCELVGHVVGPRDAALGVFKSLRIRPLSTVYWGMVRKEWDNLPPEDPWIVVRTRHMPRPTFRTAQVCLWFLLCVFVCMRM